MKINSEKNISIGKMELIKISNSAEKRKWLEKFCKSYTGGMIQPSIEIYQDNICKFFVARCGGKDMGYIRLADYTELYQKYTDLPFWSACEAYVKPCYRNEGVLRFMLKECAHNHHLAAIKIETERLNKYRIYYQSLGFTYAYTVQQGYLALAFQTAYKNADIKRGEDWVASNDEQYKLAA